MLCIYCGKETRVTNSRHQKRPNHIWRRRRCTSCEAIFSTAETPDTSQALRLAKGGVLEPFSRDELLISIYDSLRHRKTAVSDAGALTTTAIANITALAENGVIQRDSLIEVIAAILDRFDSVAATYYRAFHPETR
jgi:transcriptional regulator NrdR family protein